MATTQTNTTHEVVLLSGQDLRRLVRPQAAVDALREAYSALADSRGDQGKSIGFAVDGGSIHVKAALLPGSHLAFAAKVNVNLPNNWKVHQLPTIQGVVVVCDAKNGRPLAIMESMALTGIRTAATAAFAAQFGARKDANRVAIIGCGAQAGYQLEALRAICSLQEVSVFDVDEARAAAFAEANSTNACRVRPGRSVRAAAEGVDICVTCTTSNSPVLLDDMDLRGCFVAAMGADNPEKQEIASALMRRARILVDDLDACASGGDLKHALRDGTLSRDSVHADLADLTAGRKHGRMSADELVIFDSTGSGVQDVAVAWAAFREASRAGAGLRFDLSGAWRPESSR